MITYILLLIHSHLHIYNTMDDTYDSGAYDGDLESTILTLKEKPNPFSPKSPNIGEYNRVVSELYSSAYHKLMNTAILYAYDQDGILLKDIKVRKNKKERRRLIDIYNSSSDSFDMLYYWYAHYSDDEHHTSPAYLNDLIQRYGGCMEDLWFRLFCKYHLELKGDEYARKLRYYRKKHIIETLEHLYELKGVYLSRNVKKEKKRIFDIFYEISGSVHKEILDEMRSKR